MPLIHSGKRDGRYWRNLALFMLLLLLIVFTIVIPLFDAYTGMHPARIPVGTVTPADLGMHYSNITLSTRDGLTLRGWYVPSAHHAAVILVHAFNGNRTGTLYHAALLAKHGYGVLLYDTRAQGESGGDLYAWGWDAKWDVVAALDYLQGRADVDPERIGVLGLSAGARIALYAAAETNRISAVVAEGCGLPTFEDWLYGTEPADRIWALTVWMMYTSVQAATGIWNPMPMRRAIVRIAPTPILLIAAGSDRFSNRQYFDVAKAPKELWSRDEPGHIDALFKQPEEYEQRVVGFLDQTLLPWD